MEKFQNKKRLKIGLFSLLGLVLAGGLVFAGCKLRQRQVQPIPTVTPTPAPKFTPMPKISPTPVITATPGPTPTPDPTANWKTYTNTKYGFSIKYPNNKQVEIDTMDPYLGICNLNKSVVSMKIYPLGFQKPPIETEFGGDLAVSIDVEKNSDNLSIADWVRKNCQGSWLIDAEKEIISVAGLEATKFIRAGEGMGVPEDQPMIIFKKNDLMYFIYPYGKREIFSLMLSTFKFLE